MNAPSPKRDQTEARFRAVAQLGQGGTANVTLAVASGPSGFSKLVVLKSMRSHLKVEPEFEGMFLDEARLAARLNHPNIVQTNEVFESVDGPVIVMEYLEGQPLSSIVHRAASSNKFSVDMQVRVISEMLAGLHYAHELADFDGRPLNVVHRDISPHNVFVTFEGQVKLLDFGIAKLNGSRHETATGVLKGKLRYMAPEQIAGDSIDRRVDLYAVGVMLWEAAVGQKMWKNLGEAVIMNRILNGEVPDATEVNAAINPELLRILRKALELEPALRYQTSLELQQDLEEFLDRQAASVRLRDLGKVVVTLFAADRAETRRIVDAQLAKVSALSPAEYAATTPVELTQIGAHSGLSAANAQDASTRSQTTAVPPRRNWPVLVVLLPLFGLLVFLLTRGSPPPAPVEKPTAAEVPSTITLNVTAFPGAARLYLDGELTQSNPLYRTVPRDTKSHQLEARAPGYTTETRSLMFDQNANIVVTLSAVQPPASDSIPAPATPRVSPGRAHPPAAKPGPAGLVTKPSVDCSQPYTLDGAGVKHFKPECL